MMPQ